MDYVSVDGGGGGKSVATEGFVVAEGANNVIGVVVSIVELRASTIVAALALISPDGGGGTTAVVAEEFEVAEGANNVIGVVVSIVEATVVSALGSTMPDEILGVPVISIGAAVILNTLVTPAGAEYVAVNLVELLRQSFPMSRFWFAVVAYMAFARATSVVEGFVFFLNDLLGSPMVPRTVFLCPTKGLAAPAPPG